MPATRSTAAKLFAQTVPGGEPALRGLLDSLINSEIRGVLSSVPLHAVLTDQRANLMDEITKRVNAKTKELGVETVDVRIKRADLPQANSQSVYNRMKTDREREAGQLRAEGDEEKARITATADREVAVIKADAGLKAQIAMGEADGEATRIYAEAFNKDKDFYAFYRRMEAYKQAFGAGGSTMILSPDTDFFRYFNDPAGTAGGQEVAPENRRQKPYRRRCGSPATPPVDFRKARGKAETISNINGLFICATIGLHVDRNSNARRRPFRSVEA